MKVSILTALLFVTVLPAAADSYREKQPVCGAEAARNVEQLLGNISSWKEFSSLYADYSFCDQSALRYAFVQRIAELTAADEGLKGLSEAVRANAKLRAAVIRHLQSESVPADLARRIREKANTDCPTGEQRICRAVSKAVEDTKN